MSDILAELDNVLSAYGEDITLRRTSGSAPSQTFVDVTCRARVDAVTTAQVAAGVTSTELNVIMSPTQLAAAAWPDGNAANLLPRAAPTDKVILFSRSDLKPRAVTFVDPKFINGELVRINLRISG